MKQDWISEKIGILIKEGRPQKQAIAIAYSMWNQKHEMGGTQLPKYQFAGTAELDQYGQPLPKPLPAPTFNYASPKNTLGVPPQLANNLNKPIDLNAPTAASNKAYADQQAKAPQTISISDSELANPTMGTNIPNKELQSRMAFNKQVNTAANNYDDNGNAVDTSLAAEARKKVENSGTGITQFVNPYGDIGMDDALSFSGQQFGKGNTGAGIAGAGLALLKGTKTFLGAMGSQKRTNQIMKSYAEDQRKNMTGEDRAVELSSQRYGGYYQEGGEEYGEEEEYGDLINKYPNRGSDYSSDQADYAEVPKQSYNAVMAETEQPENKMVESPSYDKNSARDTWVQKTGMPWSKAKELGYTDGTAKDNTKLLSELNDPRFKKENLRKGPAKPAPRKVEKKAPATKTAKDFTYQDYQDAMKDKPKYVKEQGNIQAPTEGSMLNRTAEVLGNPLASFAHYAKYGELPAEGFSKNSKNAHDRVIGMLNPAAWANAALNSASFADQGEYKRAAIEGLDALPAAGKLLKYIPKGAVAASEGSTALANVGSRGVQVANKVGTAVGPARRAASLRNYFTPELAAGARNAQLGQGALRLGQGATQTGQLSFGFGNGGFFQAGGMQSPMEEGQEGAMSNPQEEQGEVPQQAGGDQMQAIAQEVAQMLQQGADPQEILQQLVQAGLPEEQAMQVIQMVMEQMQGGQQEATPQLRRGGKMYQQGGNYREAIAKAEKDNQDMKDSQYAANLAKVGSGNLASMDKLFQQQQNNEYAANLAKVGSGNLASMSRMFQNKKPNWYENNKAGMQLGYQEGGEMMDEQREGENEGTEGETPNMEQIESQVEQALKQGADPQQILEQLVQMGMPEDQAVQMIQEILQEIQGGETGMEAPEQGQPMMKSGGEYLSALKGKTIKNYTYNKNTGNYEVEFE